MKTTLWLATAQSSQRDMLLSLQALKPDYDLHIIASHTHDRPEILSLADENFQEPRDNPVPFVVENAIKHGAKVLLTGRNGIEYEPYRKQLQQAGVRLLTGANNSDTLASIDDKAKFSQICQANSLPIATAWQFDNIETLTQLINAHQDKRLCVKPTVGIFAEGFWILDTSDKPTDSFYHLYRTEHKKISTQEFIHAYQNSTFTKRTPMLLMPYLSGHEYSIDVVCEHGEVLAAVTRHKVGSVQYVDYDTDVMAVVIPLIRTFQCTGIVSVQTKADADGQHKILEINPRASGGIGYTVHSGVDLTQLGLLYFAGLIDKPNLGDICTKITPCKVRPFLTSVAI